MFALDSSGSVGDDNFKLIKDFTKDFLKDIEIGGEHTHVAILTFHNYGEVHIGLMNDFNKRSLFHQIHHLRYPTKYQTNITGALKVLHRDVFSTSGGARRNVPKILIFLTDGQCTRGECEKKKIKESAAKLKDVDGVTVFTIGVGNVNKAELKDISSDPSEQYMFSINSFSELKAKTKEIQQKSLTSMSKL